MKTNKIINYIKKSSLLIFLILNLYSCKAQNIYNNERISYTLNNFEHCFFYSKKLSESEGVDLKKINCSPYYLNKRDYTIESKKKLLEIIEKKYTNEYIRKISKKRILFGFKSELRKVSEKLKDSINFMYGDKFNKRLYIGYKKQKKKLETLLSSKKLDTIPEYKKRVENLYNYLQKYKISNSLIYAVSFVIHKDEAIPFLKGLFKDTTHINTSAVELSLAKLKVEPYFTNQLTKLKKDVNDIISNIGGDNDENSKINRRFAYPRVGLLLTKEAISIYAKVLEAKYFDEIDHGDYSEVSIPIEALEHLLKLIKNTDFKEYFKDEYGHSKYPLTKEDVKWAIEWFKKNGDKIIINDKHIPLLHNEL